MIAYRAMLDVPRALAQYLSQLLNAERRERGTRRNSRVLTCFRQAVFGLRWFREDRDVPALARDCGISRATGYRYLQPQPLGRVGLLGAEKFPAAQAGTGRLRATLRQPLPARARLRPMPHAARRPAATRPPGRDHHEPQGPDSGGSTQRLAWRGQWTADQPQRSGPQLVSLDRASSRQPGRPVDFGIPIITSP